MKIDGTKSTQGVSGASKKKRIGTAEGDFSSLLGGVEAESNNISGVQPMNMLEGLLTIQQLENDVMEKKEARKRGDDVLDVLDQLRHGLLRGKLTTMQVQNLAAGMRALNFNVADPRLQEVISAIETRAAVELAKLEMNHIKPISS